MLFSNEDEQAIQALQQEKCYCTVLGKHLEIFSACVRAHGGHFEHIL